MKSQVLVLVIVAIVTSACANPGIETNGPRASTYEEYFVELKATGTGLEITSPPQGDDKAGKKYGWVGFAKGTHGNIFFVFPEYKTKANCAAGAEWVITEVVLSKHGKKDTQKGERFGESQTGWILNAFPGIDANGYLFKHDIAEASTRATLVDSNNNQGKQTAYYEIEASRCDGEGTPIRTDPGVGNGGKK